MKSPFDKIPDGFLKKWQEIADLIAAIIDVPAALIMKTENEFMEVFTSSNTENNPYKVGDKEKWYGLYCETVIKTQKKLHVPNALKDENWDKNPDIKLGMIAYLGYPINFPNGSPFGTICVLDNKERHFRTEAEQLLLQFKKVLELDLALIFSLELQEKTSHADIIQKLSNKKEEYQAANEGLIQAQEALQKSRERLRITLNSIGDAVIATDLAGCVVDMNPVAQALTGWEGAQAQGKPLTEVFKIINAQTGEPVPNPVQRVLENGKIVGLANHTKLIARDGSEYQIADSAAPIRDADGETQGVVLVFRDVTEEYQMREVLRESEEKFRTISLNSPDHILIQNRDLEYTFVLNPQLGLSVEEMLGKTDYELGIPQEEADNLTQIKKGVLEGKRTEQMLIPISNLEGEIEYFEGSYSPKYDSNGGVNGLIGYFRNVTLRVEAEKEVKRFSRIFERSVNEIYIFNSENLKFIQVNQAAQKNLGYFQSELRQLTPLDIKPKFTREQFQQLISPLLKGDQEKLIFQTLHQRKDKSTYDVEVHLELMDFEGEEVFVAFINDITERKALEKNLLESEAKFRTLVNQAPAALFLHDMQGNIVDYNALTLERYGYAPDEILRLNTSDIDVDYLQREDDGAFWDELDKQGQLRFEARHKRKDGAIFPVSVRLSAIELQGQKFILALAEDITERVQAEAALRESEEKYRALFNQSTEGIYLHDLEGRILDVNEMACAHTGYSKEELLQRTVFDLHPGKSQLNLPKDEILQMWREWTPGQRHQVEAEHQRKDGMVYPVEVSTGLVRYQDEKALLATEKDISERVAREKRIEHLNQVLRAIRDVNQLITQEKDRDTLLWRACDILTSTRGYSTAWVALRGEDGRAYTAAECGLGADFAPLRQGMQQGEWPECCRQAWANPDKIAVVKATDRDCKSCSLSHSCCQSNTMAGVLRHGQQDFGVMVVALPEGLAGDAEEQSLFQEVVGDLAYALHAIELDQAHSKAVDALRQSEKRFRRAIDEAPFPAMIHAEDGEVVMINTAWAQITGYSHEEIPTIEAWTEKAYGARQGGLREMIDTLYEAQSYTDEGDFEVRCRDGSTRIWDFRSTPLGPDDTGRRLVLSMAVDITERALAEEALRESEEKFRKLFQDHIAVKLLIDPENGKIIDANKAAAKFYGWSVDKLKTMNISDINTLPPKEIKREMENARSQKRTFFEFKHCKADGSITDVEVFSCKVVIAGKDLLHSIIHDVSERKQAEEALRESERKHATLISNLQGMVYSCLNDQNWTMKYVSQGALALTGYQPEELIDNQAIAYADLIHPDDRVRIRETVEKMTRNHAAFELEYRIITRDRSVKWVWERGQGAFSPSGELISLEGFISDITERVRAENELRQLKDRLQEEVAQKTKELQERVEILERFHAATVERELRMKELRDEIARLKGETG